MSDGIRRNTRFAPTTGLRTNGIQNGHYVRPPTEEGVAPEIAARIKIELEKSRTDDFADAPARFAPIVIEPKPWRD